MKLDPTGTKNDVFVYKYGSVNCFEEMAILSVSHDVCVGLVWPDTKLMMGHLRVVLRMGLLLLVELSKQELKRCLVTSTGLLVVPGMRNGT